MKHELIKFSLAGMNKWIFNQTALHTNWLLLTLSNVLPDSITEVQEKLKMEEMFLRVYVTLSVKSLFSIKKLWLVILYGSYSVMINRTTK